MCRLQDVRAHTEGFRGQPEGLAVEDRVFYLLYHAPHLGNCPGAFCGIRSPGTGDYAPDTVLEDGHGIVQLLCKLLGRMLQEPVCGVFRQTQDPKIQLQIGRRGRRPFYRPLSCRVRVEEDVDPISMTAEHAQMTRGSRGAQRGDGVLDARLIEHQDIGIPFDDERCTFPADSLEDLREPVEQIPLVEDLRLWRVEVLGLGVTERSRPEADDPSPPVRDGEGDPTGKTLPSTRRQ